MAKRLLWCFTWVSDSTQDRWMDVAPEPIHGTFTLTMVVCVQVDQPVSLYWSYANFVLNTTLKC